MRTYIIFSAFAFCLMLLFSCKRSNLITYDDERILYFSLHPTDSVSINFSLLDEYKMDTLVGIPIGLIGRQLEKETSYDIVVNEQITTAVSGIDFELPQQFSYLAGKSSDTIYIKIKRTPKLVTKAYILALDLVPNATFRNDLLKLNAAKSRGVKLQIYFNDLMAPTSGWITTPSMQGTDYYLGKFSKAKLIVITKLYTPWVLAELYENIDTYPSFFGGLLNTYLKAQRAAGTPVLEEDGTLMESGPFYR